MVPHIQVKRKLGKKSLKILFAELTELIARKVGVKSCKVVLGKFANNETNVQLMDQVRCQDVYIIQTGEIRIDILPYVDGFYDHEFRCCEL